jgi:transposase
MTDNEFARAQVVALKAAGFSYTDITQITGKPKSFIQRWVGRKATTGSLKRKQGSGRPKKLTADVLSQIKRFLKAKATGSTRRTQRKLESQGIKLSQRTISNAKRQLHLRRVKDKKKPKLTEAHKAQRVEFANEARVENYWKKVLFTDETVLLLEPPPQYRYIEEGDEQPFIGRSKYARKIMVWAGISWYGKTKLVFVNNSESIDSDKYQEVLAEALPSMEDMFPERVRWIFQQDGARCHTSRATRNWLRERGLTTLDPWPANSPDLNIIENIWAVLKERVYRRSFRTEQGLFRVVKEEWEKIELQEIQKLVLSMPGRLQQVLDRDGGHTDY